MPPLSEGDGLGVTLSLGLGEGVSLTAGWVSLGEGEGVTLSLGGGFTAVTGRSGSGKSTFLKAAGLMIPAEGEIFIGGRQVSALSEREKDLLRNREIGFVFQDYSLEPAYTVRENVELPLLIAGMKAKERRARAEECLAFVGLKAKAGKRAAQLSGVVIGCGFSTPSKLQVPLER